MACTGQGVAREGAVPMKICIVSPYDFSHPGGVNEHMVHQAAELRRRGHAVTIMAPSSSHEDEHSIPGFVRIGRSVPIHANGSVARIALSFHLVRRVRRLLRDEQFDVVHYHEPLIPALPITVLRFHAGANVGTFHAMAQRNLGYYYGRPFLARYARRLDARIAVSVPARDFVQKYFPGEYQIIPNGIDTGRFRPGVGPIRALRTPGQMTVLFLGRLEKRKNLSTLLAGYAHARKYRADLRLVVGGEGRSRKSYEEWVRDNDVPDVTFLGRLDTEQLPSLYASADVFCNPATGNESFGIVLLEAMASGVPVLASDIPGFRRVIDDGVQGRLLPPTDPLAWSSALCRLADNPDGRDVMGAAGVETACQYAWPRVVDRILETYEGALVSAPGRRSTG